MRELSKKGHFSQALSKRECPCTSKLKITEANRTGNAEHKGENKIIQR